MSPATAVAGGPSFTLTAKGSVSSNCSIYWNNSKLATTYVDSSTLKATVPSSYIASAGTAAVKIVSSYTGYSSLETLTFTITGSGSTSGSVTPLAISTTSLPSGSVSKAYSAQLSAAGGTAPYTWTLASGTLPSGFTLSSGGSISGTTTYSGTYTFSVRAKDSASTPQAATTALSIVIGAQTPVLSANMPAGVVNSAYSGNLSVAGGTSPFTFSLSGGQLPAGLALNAASGLVAGTPTVAGTYPVTFSVRDSVGLVSSTSASIVISTSGTSSTSKLPPPGEMWVSRADLMARPMSGTAWNNLLNAANGSWGTANIADQNSLHDQYTLAGALVWARTGNSTYLTKTRNALMAVIGTDNNTDANCTATPNMARSMSIGRNLDSYIIAADLIGLRATSDPNSDGSKFAAWISYLRYKKNCPNAGNTWENLSQVHDAAGSNGNAMAGASRIAAAIYLGDTTELGKAWITYQRYLGDVSKCSTCPMTATSAALTWSSSPSAHPPVNLPGATINGHRVDGVIINDQSRGGSFTWPPAYTKYPWEGLQGMYVQAQLLTRAGYPAYSAMTSAPKRALDYQYWLAADTGDSRWTEPGTRSGGDSWVVWLANKVYGTTYPAGAATGGKNMAWTDWLFGK